MPLNIIALFGMVITVALCGEAQRQPDGEGGYDPNQISSPKTYDLSFEEFKLKFHKEYSSLAEEAFRKLIFEKNLAQLNNHNSSPARKYNMKPNTFLDVTSDEFKSIYGTVYASDQHSKSVSQEIIPQTQCSTLECSATTKDSNPLDSQNGGGRASESIGNSNGGKTQPSVGQVKIENGETRRRLQILDNTQLINGGQPTSKTNQTFEGVSPSRGSDILNSSLSGRLLVDWSAYAGPVRFQGYCGACYAFTTVDTVSAHMAIYNFGFFYQLSVQQIIDCANNGLSFGCYGGYLQGSLKHMQTQGILSENSYPFTSGSRGFSGTCKQMDGPFKVKSFLPLQEGSCSKVIRRLYDGPISAGISGYKLRFYDSGVFDQCTSTDRLDHAIMIVGYRTDFGWRIKNSWGVEWGEQGFGWIAEGNTCGICNMTVSVTV